MDEFRWSNTVRFLPTLLGDMDGDGNVDSNDSPLIVQALVDRLAYDSNGFANPLGFLINADVSGDINDDGTFDLGDLGAFSALFGGAASASAVPEPASASLLVTALVALAFFGRRWK